MKTFFIQLSIILINISLLNAQATNSKADTTTISNVTDKELVSDSLAEEIIGSPELFPTFPGGEVALRKFINENMQLPSNTRNYENSKIRVFVGFTVTKTGEIVDVKIVHSNGDPLLEKEALRLIKLMPKWEPGRYSGEPKDFNFRQPIIFSFPE